MAVVIRNSAPPDSHGFMSLAISSKGNLAETLSQISSASYVC